MSSFTRETDVFVVGGGPAGLAAALAARQAGFNVMVADCGNPPIDKACGEGIMPDGLAALQQLGVDLDASSGAPFSGIRFINGSQQVEAKFHHGTGLGVRRTVLHQRLVEAASLAGVQTLWNRRVTNITNGSVWLDGEAVGCRWIIGADGQNSRVRSWCSLGGTHDDKVRFGVRQHYRVKPWSDSVEVHWSDCGQMYVTPVGIDAVCVVFISSQKTKRIDDVLEHFPALASSLKEAIPEGAPRGAVTASRRLKKVNLESVALIGEAAGSVDAITGEGLAAAFRQATALAGALTAHDLSLYGAAHKKTMRLPRAMAALMLSMDGRSALRPRVFRALESQPAIFARMLAIHTGAVPLVQFGIQNTVLLGWHLLSDAKAS